MFLEKLQFNIVRVGSEQKYDLNSPIMNVMLNNLVRERMNNPSDINVSFILKYNFFNLFYL